MLKNKVVGFLKQLSLTSEQALAYLYLLEHGPQTVLTLSRGLKTGRTKLYPLLEDLAGKQLIAIHERHYGTSYEALPPETLEFLISEKERKAELLRSKLPAITHTVFLQRQRTKGHPAKVGCICSACGKVIQYERLRFAVPDGRHLFSTKLANRRTLSRNISWPSHRFWQHIQIHI